MSEQDDSYVRSYIRNALAGITLEQPDKSKVNGAYEALYSLWDVQKLGGDVVESWQRIVRNWPDFEQYAPQPSKWKVYSPSGLRDLPPLEFLVSGMIVSGGFNVMFGASGVGKSFVALGVAENLSQRMKVLYVAGEGASGYRLRLDALEARNGRKISDNMLFVPGAVNLIERGEVNQFIEDVVSQYQPRLVVFDTLARCMVGGDENSSRDMGIVIDHCGLIQKQGVAVLLIHHTGKNGSGERGSSALRGAADSMIDVYKHDELITVESSKLKDGKEFATYHVQLMPFASSVAAVPVSKIAITDRDRLTSQQYNVLEILAMEVFYDGGCRATVLRNQMQPVPSEGTFYRIVSKLMRRNLVKKAGKQDPYLITQDGLEALRDRINAAKSETPPTPQTSHDSF